MLPANSLDENRCSIQESWHLNLHSTVMKVAVRKYWEMSRAHQRPASLVGSFANDYHPVPVPLEFHSFELTIRITV
jgi:hypothetical protein